MLRSLRRDLATALVAVAVLTVVLGLAYPLLVTGVAQVAFPHAAGGSLLRDDAGRVVGSRLLGQRFAGARWFHSRPSQSDYSATATFFSNAGPNGADTRATIAAAARAYLSTEARYAPGLTRAAIPPDAVQTSASGVDPHVSPENARIQAHRVAEVRGLALARVHELIDAHTDGRGLGLFGEPGVNVLELNLALEQESSR
jgi:potassium-transporting ATPase KdpC subunit